MSEQEREDGIVEIELANSEVLAQGLATGQRIVLAKGGVQLTVERDARGQCQQA